MHEQNSRTNHNNIEFNSYFVDGDNSTYDSIKNIGEDNKLAVQINVKNAGYLKDAKVEFIDSNFRISNDVLTERIVSLIKEGHPIESLLVLTFTNLAADEMKERVRKKLTKEIDNELCKEALKYIDSAKIMTFDGYSLYLVKKYFYELKISRDIMIADEYYMSIKSHKIIDDILDELYGNSDKDLK